MATAVTLYLPMRRGNDVTTSRKETGFALQFVVPISKPDLVFVLFFLPVIVVAFQDNSTNGGWKLTPDHLGFSGKLFPRVL